MYIRKLQTIMRRIDLIGVAEIEAIHCVCTVGGHRCLGVPGRSEDRVLRFDISSHLRI